MYLIVIRNNCFDGQNNAENLQGGSSVDPYRLDVHVNMCIIYFKLYFWYSSTFTARKSFILKYYSYEWLSLKPQ